MEILVILAVLVIGLWFLFFRKDSSVSVAAPYKVEAAPTPEPVVVPVVEVAPVPAGDVAPQPVPASVVVEGAGVVEVAQAVVETAPVKKPRKPRAPKVVAPVEKPAAKKAAPVKKAAAIKAAPKKPRSKKA
jgi:hypothetical protein